MNTLANLLGIEDENEEDVNPNVRPYNGVVEMH